VSEDPKAKPITNAAASESSSADKHTEPQEAETAEKGTGGLAKVSAEEAYFSALEKDDTLIKKPKTLPIIEQPELERSVRWGSVFLGKSAMLALRIKGRPDPIHIEITGQYVIGRVHPRSEERPDLDLNKFGAFFHGVSRKHVSITKDGNLLQIEDLGSTNGTYLNGMKLYPHQPRMLRDGDELCLGHLVMRVHFLNLESDLMR
jgi:hypothetical protein